MTSFYKGLLRLSEARYVDGLATGHFFPSPSQCLRPTRFFQFSMPLFRGVAEVALHWAHQSSFQASSLFLSWNGTRVGPTAAVERAHSDRARSGSKGSARVSFRSPRLR
jgi:hypothetical protein